MGEGMERIQESANRLALSRAIRQPDREHPIDPLVAEFMHQHPEVLGVKIEGRLDTERPPKDELELRMGQQIADMVQKMKDDPVGTLHDVTQVLRKRVSHENPPGERQRIEQLLREKAEEIVIEIRSANARTIFNNMKDDASIREHLRLAMEDYFR